MQEQTELVGLPAVARSYVVITPARNEEAHIERLIESVVAQTVRPRRYVIVSDGSTDRTDEIVQRLADEHDFITFVRAGDEAGAGAGKNFGSKVFAFNVSVRPSFRLPTNFGLMA